MPVEDLGPSPPVRIEPGSSGEGRSAAERRTQKPAKVAAIVNSSPKPAPPDVDFENEERHKLDEQA